MTTVGTEPSSSSNAGLSKSGSAGKHLTFVLNEGHYGVGILRVREIIAMHAITPLPRLPEYVRGVINLRGKIIPVIDLRLRLGLNARESDRATCIIVIDVVLQSGLMSNIGCVVDAVSEVADIQEDELQPPPARANGTRPEAIRALAMLDGGDRVVTILDIECLLGELLGAEGLAKSLPEAA